jgi:uncharacterized membrane protein
MTAKGRKNRGRTTENIDTILRLEKQEEHKLALHHRIFHAIGGFVGTTHFILLQCLAVGCWALFNLYVPTPVDEYPFPLLATILALEAVLLTSCVLIRQNLVDQALKRRDHLELQINLLAEREATRSLRLLQKITEKLGIADVYVCNEDELAKETCVDEIAEELEAREEREKRSGPCR